MITRIEETNEVLLVVPASLCRKDAALRSIAEKLTKLSGDSGVVELDFKTSFDHKNNTLDLRVAFMPPPSAMGAAGEGQWTATRLHRR